MKHTPAEILREYGPFPGVENVAGVTFDGERVWFASGNRLNALDPEGGEIVARARRRRRRGDRLRRQAPVPDRRGGDPEDRPGYRRGARHDPGARQRRGFGARLGRRVALGRPAPRPPDPSGRSRDRSRAPHHRVRIASSPASPGSMASSGTAPGRARRATSAASTPRPARCSSASKCRRGPACRGSSPTAATGSSAAPGAAEGESHPPTEKLTHTPSRRPLRCYPPCARAGTLRLEDMPAQPLLTAPKTRHPR